MTRARALKQVIRARAAKTGERYTTARRHILKELNDHDDRAPVAVSSKGGLSDAKTIEKTGHGLAHWFQVLDRFGAIEKGHTAATTLLYENYNVPGWYCQGIVVAYERARGKRVLNQKCDGSFEVSVSKVIAAKTPALVKALSDAKQRKRWSAKADAGLVNALEAGLKSAKSKGIVTRPDGLVRYRHNWDGMTVQWYLTPKGPGKTLLVATTMKLPSAAAVEPFRALWKTAFAAIADAVTATPMK
jgi:hypothetical protein